MAAIWRSRKVFSAVFVTSAAVAGHRDHRAGGEDRGVELHGTSRGHIVDPADDPVVLADVPEEPADHHPLGGVRQGKVLLGDEPGLGLQDLPGHPGGRAGRRSGAP